jgi:hypothetical protein
VRLFQDKDMLNQDKDFALLAYPLRLVLAAIQESSGIGSLSFEIPNSIKTNVVAHRAANPKADKRQSAHIVRVLHKDAKTGELSHDTAAVIAAIAAVKDAADKNGVGIVGEVLYFGNLQPQAAQYAKYKAPTQPQDESKEEQASEEQPEKKAPKKSKKSQ